MMRTSRTPEIMGDAAYVILAEPSRECLPGEAERWQLQALSVWHDYVGCVAYRGDVSPLTSFSIS